MSLYSLAAVLAVVAFATIGVFVKLLVPEFPLPWITFMRAFFGFLFVLFLIPRYDPNFRKLGKQDVKEYVWVGLSLAATMTFYNYAFALAPLADVVLLNYTHVLFAPVLAYFILKERMERRSWIYLITGMLGIVLISPFTGLNVLGNSAALAAGITYAIMVVYMRRADKHHGIGDVVWFLGFASLFLFIPALMTPITWTGEGFLLLALAGIVTTGLGYLFFNIALEKLRVHQVSMLDLVLGSLIALMASVFLFGDPLTWNVALGGSILVASGWLFIRRQHLFSLGLKRPHSRVGIYGTSFLQLNPRPKSGRRPGRIGTF
ncbi:MAG: DMT family transporter [Candidatus Diapherotrites archaeon]|nr:DMT family transporter [Candidatus Diapherotrites archaeon]MDZ4256333.1 DMT family transporter [archaeon]